VAGCCKYPNKPTSSIKRGEFLDQMNCCQLFKKNSESQSQSVGAKTGKFHTSVIL
jgi:hypothetical protein